MIKRLTIPVVIFAVSIIALVLAIEAEGRHYRARTAVHYSPIMAAYTLAAKYWNAVPCGGNVTFVVSLPPPNDENGGVGAGMWSSWNVGTPTENDETAQLPFSNCTVGINSTVWRSTYLEAYTAWPEFAVGVIHEWGHLLGQSHSSDPLDVMAPEPSAKLNITGDFAPGWSRG